MQGETILCIATRAWDSLWRDSQQIMSRLAGRNRILYFDPGRNPDRPLLPELWRNLPNLSSLRAREVVPGLHVIPTPSSLPIARRFLPRHALRATTPLVIKTNSWVLTRHVRRVMAAFEVQSPILWLYDPKHIDLVGRLGEKLDCYFNYDDYPEFAHNRRIKEMLRRLDDDLCRRANVVFTTSRGQWSQRRAHNPATYLIPNGVDYELFNKALAPETAIPSDIAQLPRPLVGYVGWLGYQVDADLLLYIAEACPDCALALVGPDCLVDDGKRRRLRTLPNVHFLGQKSIHELPGYLKALDVALIPYVIGGHTLTVYPLKLHEYLAAGLPVVTTALPELSSFREVVRIADTYADFVRQIRLSIATNSPQAVSARVAVAKENTWDKRVTEIDRILNQQLAGLGEKPSEKHIYRLDSVQPAK